MECYCNYKVEIYKFVGELPARMGEAQGRGSMWRNRGLRYMFHSTHPPRQSLTLRAEAPSLWQKGRAYTCADSAQHLMIYERKASLICLPWLPQGRWRCAERVSANTSRMSGVFALRTAFILAHAQGRCASSTRKRYRLFGYKPHFRAAAGSPCRSRYRFARFGECGFYLKNTMHLLRIL